MRLVWAEINLSAIRHNIRQVKQCLDPETRIMSIIKANGYGHGADKIAKDALEEYSDYFGVAVLSEAIDLRKKWVTKPILIMGYTDWVDYDHLISFDIMQTVFNLRQAEKLAQVALRRDAIIKVHIKIDTGMHRIGFLDTPESLEEIAAIARMPGIEIHGIFSHMANADSGDMAYCSRQLERFFSFTARLEEKMVAISEKSGKGMKIPLKHIANSATTLIMPEARLDMVRPGIVLYGQYPSPWLAEKGCGVDLREAMTLKARIVNLLRVGPGARVSYGGTFETRRDTVIATLPVGYADGIPRSLSNRGEVLLKGRRVPMIGNICMDQMMIDVTGVPDVALEDEVVILGRQGEECIRVDEVAALAGTIGYEILTNISERVPRVYINEEF